MSNWRNVEIGKVIDFNPSESIKKGTIAKKIPMDRLTVFEKKIKGFEFSEYSAGPKFRNGDTLVAKITPCLENGKTAKVDILEENEVAFGSSEFIVLRENVNTINDFIFYLAKSPAFRKRAISCMEGTSGRKRVNEGALKLQVLPIPDKITQQKIAKVLSDLDAKIELNNKINSELEAMAKTLYDYWFVQFDFPAPETSSGQAGKPYKTSGGKMVWNDELKRDIPAGWEVGTLDSIGDIIGGCTPSKAIEDNFCNNEGTPWITPKDLSNNKGKKFITRGEYDVTEKGLKEASLKIMPSGTVLLSSRAPIGYLAIARNNVTTNQGFKSFVPKKRFSSEYIYFAIQNHIPEIEANSSGSTFKEVSSSTLKTIKTILPQDEILFTFNEKIKPIFKKQDCIELENQELASLRDWLLPMLMNGQVSVGEVAEDYFVTDEVLGMVAEPNNTETFNEIMNQLNFDYEIATIASLTFQKFKHNYGKKFIHKMFSNIELLNTLPVFKELAFEEKGWGMFSTQIKKAIEEQKFIQFEKINDTQKVIKLNMKHLIEVSTWMKKVENQEFIKQVNNMLTIYENPIINKKMDNIEFFNTVLECMKVLKTDDFKSVYKKMQNWPMEEEGYATKADKFGEKATQNMISFIKEIKN